MLLGEMRGQLRELVHSVNNLNSKVDGLTREVVALGPLGAAVTDLNSRVEALEAAGNKHSGATETVKAILGSPFVAYIVMVAGFVWATLTGRLSLGE
jgi:outer membrane murein-binding lipoprotein Lpp